MRNVLEDSELRDIVKEHHCSQFDCLHESLKDKEVVRKLETLISHPSDEEIYISHEGLLLHYEEALTRPLPIYSGDITSTSEDNLIDEENGDYPYYCLSA